MSITLPPYITLGIYVFKIQLHHSKSISTDNNSHRIATYHIKALPCIIHLMNLKPKDK